MSEKVNASAHIAQISEDFFFDCQKKTLFTTAGSITLNRAEKEVLYKLIAQSPKRVSKEELIAAGWARKEVAETSLFQTIRTLRIKLKEEKIGQIIELVPRLGYKIKLKRFLTREEIHSVTSIPKPPPKKRKRQAKPYILLSLILVICVLIAGYFASNRPVEYKYKLVNDNRNNTFIFLSMKQADFDSLLQTTALFFKPTKLANKLMFIHKLGEEFSIAICSKTPDGCDIDSAHAISFKHSELNTLWQLLDQYLPQIPPLAAMNVLKDNTTLQSGVKSYNIFLEDGEFNTNLSHHFVNQVNDSTWLFTSINYRPNSDKSEYIAASFRGGRAIMKPQSQLPFIITVTNYPEYFYWVLSPSDKAKLGIKPPGPLESLTNDFYVDVAQYNSYLLYRQPHLQLWLSEGYGFHWFIKDGSKDNVFNQFIRGEKCSELPIQFDNKQACPGKD
ncbi:helix-turn-helix domain-containing protein (plasmid) [Photobacterium sp. DA100]|uniref:winged helix-turn-helix domain-containing protein n=1 Tax=Photobacterium sp. DA100 TaxID=3027472 RepID=UPI002478A0F4|nr:helix-turn-helix domain-containing protein [Photobacterium sp. DA100]WEM45841.1 helix-turn-helix domain-containing protein [Photobacterium sp. DA100]